MQLVAEKFFKAKDSYTQNAKIQNAMQDKLLSLLPKKDFRDVFEFGCGTGSFTQKIMQEINHKSLLCNDINDYKSYFPPIINFIPFDINQIKENLMHKTFELIISNACIQWIDQEKFFKNITAYTIEGSILALGSFGSKNLHEIATLTKHSLPYLSLETYQQLLTPEWEILHLSEEIIPLNFPTPLEAFKHLKLTGTNSLDQNFTITKKLLKDFQLHHNNTLTYNPIYIVAKKY